MRNKAMVFAAATMVLAPVGTAIAVPVVLGVGGTSTASGRADDCATAPASRACARLNSGVAAVQPGTFYASQPAALARVPASQSAADVVDVALPGSTASAPSAPLGRVYAAVGAGQVEAGAGAGQAGAGAGAGAAGAGAGAGAAAGAGGIAGLGVAGSVAAVAAGVALTAVAVDQVASDDDDDTTSP